MLPTIAEFILIVVLLVPGFLSIQVYNKTIPSKKISTFDTTVLSVFVSLIIHGTYTTTFLYFNVAHFLELTENVLASTWSKESSIFVTIYLALLYICAFLLGLLMCALNNKGKIQKIQKAIGFTYSPHENIWDEIIFTYHHKDVTPMIVINYKDKSYKGWVLRASFDLEVSDKRDLALGDPFYRRDENDVWRKLEYEIIYLDLSKVESVFYINGDQVIAELQK